MTVTLTSDIKTTNRCRIIVSVTNDLVTDQRVHRACMAMHEAGYCVTLVGRRLQGSERVERPYRTQRIRLLFKRKALFYAEYNIRLFFKLLFSRADCFYANDTDTLLANYCAARIRGKALFFDAHEMFPEVPELVGRPAVKRVWQGIEDWILPRMARRMKEQHGGGRMAAVTVCQSIADIYRERYGLEMGVVRNVPMRRRKAIATSIEKQNILLYQGAVNIGRGIEWVMDAMRYLPDYRFVIAGVGDVYDKLRAKNDADNVVFMGRLEPEKLYELTLSARLGISLLENRGLNYYYSLPNRIADFVQAGVPVLATDFPEIRRVVEGYGIGTLVPPQPFDAENCCSEPPDAKELARKIEETVSFWDAMAEDERQTRFAKAAADLSWDNDKKTLLEKINYLVIKP